MRIFNLLLATTLAVSPVAFAAAIGASPSSLDAVQLEKRAIQLDEQSRVALGVSIRALNLLIEVSLPSPSFYRKDSLVQEGLWPALQELQKNGYVRFSSVFGDPFSHDPNSRAEFEKILVSDKGKAVANALRRTFDSK